MGKEEKFNRKAYADMLTGNLDETIDIASQVFDVSKTNGKTSLPYALMGYTPEQCVRAESFAKYIHEQQEKEERAVFMEQLRLSQAKFRKLNETKQFFRRTPSRNAANNIEIDEQTVVMLGDLWKANLRVSHFHSDDCKGLDIPSDIVWAGTVALNDVSIDFPMYLECGTTDENKIDTRARISKARFIMRDNYQDIIVNGGNQEAFCDVQLTFCGRDFNGRPYEFVMGTELMVSRDDPDYVFYNDEYAIKGRVPGRLMAYMAERILVYYTAVWYSIMLAYLHPLTITSIVDVGKRMCDEYAHNPVKNKPPLKNIKYLKMDGKTLERVLYHSKLGKCKKYERHTLLWPVRGYRRQNGTWVGPQWRGPLAKMKKLSEAVTSRQRKIVGVSLEK